MFAQKGLEASNFKHGGRSKYVGHLFGEMATAYNRAVTDPELLSLAAELALTEARIVDTLEQRRLGASGDRYRAIGTALEALETAGRAQDGVAAADALRTLKTLVAAGNRDAALELELTAQLDLKRRLASTQARILRDTHQMLTQGQVLEVIAQLVDVVRRNVTNPSEITAVVVALSGLLDTGDRAPPDARRRADG
jgi:hypothetical protein